MAHVLFLKVSSGLYHRLKIWKLISPYVDYPFYYNLHLYRLIHGLYHADTAYIVYLTGLYRIFYFRKRQNKNYNQYMRK